MIASLFDKTGFTQHRIARVWARVLLVVAGMRVEVEGLEKLDPGGSYVLVANHLSLMDTPLRHGAHPPAVPLLRQAGAVPRPLHRRPPAPRRAPAGGAGQPARGPAAAGRTARALCASAASPC